MIKRIFIVLLLITSFSSISNAQFWKRVKDSINHKKQYGLYGGFGGFQNFNIDAGLYYNRYKFVYSRRKAVGLEMMVFPYRAFAPKISYHIQVLAYLNVGGQIGVFTDFKSLAPFARPEIGYSYRKYFDIRVGKNFQPPFITSDLSKQMNTWQVSFVYYLRVFSKKK